MGEEEVGVCLSSTPEPKERIAAGCYNACQEESSLRCSGYLSDVASACLVPKDTGALERQALRDTWDICGHIFVAQPYWPWFAARVGRS